MRKTTRAEFNRFKKAFLYWQERLGLKEYRVSFFHKKLDNMHACIDTDVAEKLAEVSFSNERILDCECDPEGDAKHEALHLLIARLKWIADCRYPQRCDIFEEDEAIVVRLEKVLK